ncbi:hypothetical protein C0989_012577 [Termitomyces sp. Mn162]|nr:hypothetical protein C0989_012577 [Termitomyces sp. Mn162]
MISDHVSKAIADLVVTKVLSYIEEAATKLNSSANFAAAADARQAVAMLALNKATEHLTGVSTSLMFCEYSADETWDIVTATFSRTASVKPKTYNIIAHFVPYHGHFDPQDQMHLCTIEDENNFKPNSITSASWLKAAEKRGKN